MAYQLIQGDAMEWARNYRGPLYHGLLCDAPYHLTSIVKRFGGKNAAPAKFGTDGAFSRQSAGFMGKKWDGVGASGVGIAFDSATWSAFGTVMHPGALGMAFASSRGWHRMACAIEGIKGVPLGQLSDLADFLYLARHTRDWDLVEAVEENMRALAATAEGLDLAGFIIHPTIFCWSFGSGFPKAQRIDTVIDRRAGATRPTVGKKKHAPKFNAEAQGYRKKDNGYNTRGAKDYDLTAPATAEAAAWENHRHGLQTLKPAVEPIIVFQKRFKGVAVDNIIATGAGAFNIEASRIGDESIAINRWEDGAHPFGDGAGNPYTTIESAGRWPANFVLLHNPHCTDETCMPTCAVLNLADQAAGQTQDPSEFYFAGHWSNEIAEGLDLADPVGYYSKPSRAEREAGLDGNAEATINDGRKKPIDNAFQRGKTPKKNTHPTVKPIALAHWLASLMLPPAAIGERRLVVPFAGVASEMIGGVKAGFDLVTGIEGEDEYIPIGLKRLAEWEQRPLQAEPKGRDAARAAKKTKAAKDGETLDLFAHSFFDME
jgi:hypothetical protein